MFLVLKKKKLVIVCMLAFFLVLVFGFFGKNNSKQTFFEAEGKTVIIDAGHVAQTQYNKNFFKKHFTNGKRSVKIIIVPKLGTWCHLDIEDLFLGLWQILKRGG